MPLKFDFAIFDKEENLSFLIEYDGKQHYEPVDFAGKGPDWASQKLKETQERDAMKNRYCKDNNISLIRIPYWQFDSIDCIIQKLARLKKDELDNFLEDSNIKTIN